MEDEEEEEDKEEREVEIDVVPAALLPMGKAGR